MFVGPAYTGKGLPGCSTTSQRPGRPGSNVAFLHTGDTGNLIEIPEVVGNVAGQP